MGNDLNHSVLRACFKSFLGELQYRKFLEAGVGRPLRYWQEQALASFAEAHPQLAVGMEDFVEALRVCPEHERPLVVGYTESVEGHNFAPLSEQAKLRYPCAPRLPLRLEGGPCRVLYCAECIEVAGRRSQ